LVLNNSVNITLVGATDASGAPATLLLKHNDLKWGQPELLKITKSSNLIVRNFKVDMKPYYSSAGKITRINGSQVDIEVLPGHPRINGQKAHVMGLYDLNQKRILINRLTWDGTTATSIPDLPSWTATGETGSRTMTMNYPRLASNAMVGQAVFWFQGNFYGQILSLTGNDGLLVENVRIFGGHGFPLHSTGSKDVTYRDVQLAPPTGRIVTSVRDGLNLGSLAGRVLMERVLIDGCAGDDGSNIHSIWLATNARVDSRTLLAEKGHNRSGSASLPRIGDTLKILDADYAPWWSGIVTAASLQGELARITVDRDLPVSLPQRRAVEMSSRLPDSVHFKDCTYRNTGRFGLMIKTRDTLIENCVFEYNYAAIEMGAEFAWGLWLEGTNPQRVTIRGCTFRDNNMRLAGNPFPPARGGRSIVLNGVGKMTDLYFHDNTFINETVPITLSKANRVWIWNNTYQNCGTPRVVNDGTATNVNFTAPPP
jgi:hypothetical protein